MANTSGATARITKEIANIQKGADLSLAVACRDSDVRHVRALIIGPPETPYEFGFFEFEIKFGKDYPIKSPNVRCITTNGGRCRFNPNIYAEGKVCLSILGTWRGQPGEEWSSAQGLESVLLSIQSLMSVNPYENEPGYEDRKKDEDMPKKYVAKIRHESLRIAVLKRVEGLLNIQPEKSEPPVKKLKGELQPPPNSVAPPKDDNTNANGGTSAAYEYDAEATFSALDTVRWDPFSDLLKRRFLWHYDSYLASIAAHSREQRDKTAFTRMEFEYPPNAMDGSFEYGNLHTRFERVHAFLEEERKGWIVEGTRQVANSTQLATQLAFQFKQLQHQWNETQYASSRMELNLPEPANPFLWNLTFFGKPMTNLDGGIFNITLSIPPNFPHDAQPRVKFETPIFHHRVSASTGILCYFPDKEDEIASHLVAIVAAIEDNEPKFDPRAVVSPEAFGLYWGGEDKRKVYNRKLRRSAQDSSEF